MAEGYNFLEGSQTDINRRIVRKLKALESTESIDKTDVAALKTTVGDSSSGLVKTVADHTTAIGKASGTGAGGILKDVADVKSAIGTEETEGSILYRIKALEDAE